MTGYVHGYDPDEAGRLGDQASALSDLLHHDTYYPAGGTVLEAGCGVGAQTAILARGSPLASFTSVDISEDSLSKARRKVEELGLSNVQMEQADVLALPYDDRRFDHVFVCFLLEHIPRPEDALRELRRVLRPGGSMTVIEGDHGSASFHPDSEVAHRSVRCLVDLQREAGGDPMIGRRLYPLLTASGMREVRVSPRLVYCDGSRPRLQEGFVRQTFTAMVDGVGPRAIGKGMMGQEEWSGAIAALLRTAEPDGVFSYTFYKATCIR